MQSPLPESTARNRSLLPTRSGLAAPSSHCRASESGCEIKVKLQLLQGDTVH